MAVADAALQEAALGCGILQYQFLPFDTQIL